MLIIVCNKKKNRKIQEEHENRKEEFIVSIYLRLPNFYVFFSKSPPILFNFWLLSFCIFTVNVCIYVSIYESYKINRNSMIGPRKEKGEKEKVDIYG